MEILVDRACGIDVHKATVVACTMGTGIKKEIKTYTIMTNDLLRLKEWLKGHDITHVAMESTGVFWKPEYNTLEDAFEVILVGTFVYRSYHRLRNSGGVETGAWPPWGRYPFRMDNVVAIFDYERRIRFAITIVRRI